VITVEISGVPKGKGRPRFVRATGHAFTPQPTRSYESALKYSAHLAMTGKVPLEGPLRIELSALFPIPASWSQKKKAAAAAGNLRPTGRPDLDNLMKMLDAFNGVVWRDDAQVVSASIRKAYSDKPRLVVTVEAAL